MPHHLIIGNAIHSSAASPREAQTGLSTLRAQGLKPRLFYSLSFDSFGSELDDDGRPLHLYILMSTDEFESYLTRFERIRLLTDPEHAAPPLRVVDVQGVLEGRDYHGADRRRSEDRRHLVPNHKQLLEGRVFGSGVIAVDAQL